jgi:DNA-binding LacI/PurR family transcriptional regulator
MASLLALAEPPTAIVTSGDTLALGAMSACREAGLRLPDDIALVSFDDPEFGSLLDPPVTALARGDLELGRVAAKLLLDGLRGEAPADPPEVRLPVELVVRRSCGCTP